MTKEQEPKEPKPQEEASFRVEVTLNKWADLHFKKAVLEKLQKISGIVKGDVLKMEFKPNGVVLLKKVGRN